MCRICVCDDLAHCYLLCVFVLFLFLFVVVVVVVFVLYIHVLQNFISLLAIAMKYIHNSNHYYNNMIFLTIHLPCRHHLHNRRSELH